MEESQTVNPALDSDVVMGSGMGSGSVLRFQQPVRDTAAALAKFMKVDFHPSDSGYRDEKIIAENKIRRWKAGVKTPFIGIGHSNFVYAITAIAYRLREEEIPCRLIAIDQTLKECPPIFENVTHAVDIWAGLQNLTIHASFRGKLERYNFRDDTHVGIISNPTAQQIIIDTVKRWQVGLGLHEIPAYT